MTDALVPSRTILRMCMLKKASYTSVQCLFLVLMLLRSILSLSSIPRLFYTHRREQAFRDVLYILTLSCNPSHVQMRTIKRLLVFASCNAINNRRGLFNLRNGM